MKPILQRLTLIQANSNQTESLSGIETIKERYPNLTSFLQIKLNPYQGLKQVAPGGYLGVRSSNQTESLSGIETHFYGILTGINQLQIKLNPYQGLKRSQPS